MREKHLRILWPALLFLWWHGSASGRAQDLPVICTDGEGRFSAEFATGVTVSVGATRVNGLAGRSCAATIESDTGELNVVDHAAEVDVDVMGADLGLGGPVVAIQYRKSGLDRQITYEIYSLKNPPQLLRTLTGSAFYSAADYQMDGKIDLRTVDAALADGFDGIPLSSFDVVPPVYLRIENHKLVDVNSEYRREFDAKIAELKSGLDRSALAEFKQSDGVLAAGFKLPEEELHALITVKIQVLEMVWAYVYSGRESEAWKALGEMWPVSDVERVRTATLNALKRGVVAEADEIATSGPPSTGRLPVYYPPGTMQRQQILEWNGKSGGVEPADVPATVEEDRSAMKRLMQASTSPTAIYQRETCVRGNCTLEGNEEVPVEMVIDDAGKVRSANIIDPKMKGPAFDALLRAALTWRFIPASKSGAPVACEVQQMVSPNR